MVAQSLRESLVAAGYTLVNPFGLLPGKSYLHMVRLFVAPASGGWVRVIGSADAASLPPLSRLGVCLALALDGDRATITIYANGQPADLTALRPFLRPGRADEVQKILSFSDVGVRHAVPLPSELPLDALPAELQSLAGSVNPAQAQKLFARLSAQALKRAGAGSDAEAARALLSNEGAPDWNSAGGQQLRALMSCLTVPENWREPDFTTLRDAYQLHERRRRLPNARLYPGDAEALARVPDALAYLVVYGGRD
ncbi:MAG: hypothetical protein HZC41_12645 [Chloroflexi bacterium]|nr:hypothetical protein [Chloroflexota bacterium]